MDVFVYKLSIYSFIITIICNLMFFAFSPLRIPVRTPPRFDETLK